MTESPTRVVTVEIQGLRYPIRSALDPAYVAQLAAYVDAKIQAASAESPTSESVKVAVLAALNIADEYFRGRERDAETLAPESQEALARRALQLERLMDQALEGSSGE